MYSRWATSLSGGSREGHGYHSATRWPVAHYVFGEGATTLAEAQHNFAPITYTGGDNGTYFDKFGILQTSAADTSRFDHDPASGAPLGLLIEGSGTNLRIRSRELNVAPWSLVRNTISANARIGPDGNMTMDGLVASADDNNHRTQAPAGGETLTGSTVYTWSAVVAVGDKNWAYLVTEGTSPLAAKTTYFNNSAGTIGTTGANHTPGIKDLGGGLYKIWAAFTSAGTSNQLQHICAADGDNDPTFIGDASTIDIYAGDAQLEIGAFPSSIITTTSAIVTRTADIPTTTLSDIPGFDVTDHSGLFEGRTALGGGTQTLTSMDDGTVNERIYIERNSSDEIHLVIVDGGVTQADLNLGTVADDTDLKVAYRVAANDYAGSLDGAAVVTDTGGTMPTVTTLRWGHNYTSANHWNRTISRGALWNGGNSNAILRGLAS